jgi:hypothetical protein
MLPCCGIMPFEAVEVIQLPPLQRTCRMAFAVELIAFWMPSSVGFNAMLGT